MALATQQKCSASEVVRATESAARQLADFQVVFAAFCERQEVQTPCMKALESVVSSVYTFVLRGLNAALLMVKSRRLDSEGLDRLLVWLADALTSVSFGHVVDMSDTQLEAETKLLRLQGESVARGCGSVMLRVALGTAVTPYELLQDLDVALARIDGALLGPAFIAQHLHKDCILRLLPPQCQSQLPTSALDRFRRAYEATAAVGIVTSPADGSDLDNCRSFFESVNKAVGGLEDTLMQGAQEVVEMLTSRQLPSIRASYPHAERDDPAVVANTLLSSLRGVVCLLAEQLYEAAIARLKESLAKVVAADRLSTSVDDAVVESLEGPRCVQHRCEYRFYLAMSSD